MAKWNEPSDETLEAIQKHLIDVGLFQLVTYKVIVNDDQKRDVIKVKKLTEDLKYAWNCDLLITINEEIFDGLTEELQKQCIIHDLSGVSYNLERDRLEVKKPDYNIYSGFMNRYSPEQANVLKESIKSLYDNKNNKEE